VAAPSIEFKHCLSVSGYGYVTWSIAILGALCVEIILEHHPNKHFLSTVPLSIIEFSGAVAQVYNSDIVNMRVHKQ
jgi:hypothetical protein